ncbi:MAG TPA: hypothetical protein DCF68_08140 [Cyanothece sp. UBA12306]|nr:hypothetical protein [Cyanothece sp. UBA12306]
MFGSYLSFFVFCHQVFGQSNQPILGQTMIQNENWSPESNSQFNKHSALIIGVWRGFQEIGDNTFYYGYQFRPDGTFLSRHRLYHGEETVEDEFWQGKWTFDGQILQIEGNNHKDPQQSLNIKFRLTKDLQFYYEDGSLPEPYSGIRLNKTQ